MKVFTFQICLIFYILHLLVQLSPFKMDLYSQIQSLKLIKERLEWLQQVEDIELISLIKA